jgi:protocatechuate 3,4-dioxygenase alpha subunit
MTSNPTASQTIGPFFRVALERPAWSDLTQARTRGGIIRIEGVVCDGDRAPVPEALLELWQADASGCFAHPDDTRSTAADPHFRGFGRACTDTQGRFAFRTVLPGIVAAPGGGSQAPHANLSIFARGLLKRLVTRIYFADHREQNAVDPLLAAIGDPARRRTLIAERGDVAGIATYRFDIVLQGEGETVFLDV